MGRVSILMVFCASVQIVYYITYVPCVCLLYVPCLVRVRPYVRHFHQVVCYVFTFLLYVPCLVRVRPYVRHFHQVVYYVCTCLLYAPCLVRVRPYIRHFHQAVHMHSLIFYHPVAPVTFVPFHPHICVFCKCLSLVIQLAA